VIDGVLNINGQPVKREQVEDYIPVEGDLPKDYARKPIKRWREMLPQWCEPYDARHRR
jgi:hypothetical protein